jgi:CcmD family protein
MGTLYFLFAAYSVTWIVLFWYMYRVWRKQDRIEKGIESLNEQLRK